MIALESKLVFKLNQQQIERLLCTINFIYDPFSTAAQFLVTGKKVLHRLCQSNLGLDDPIQPVFMEWTPWKKNLYFLEEITNFTSLTVANPVRFGTVKQTSPEITYNKLVTSEW